MLQYREDAAISATWAAAERVLVCIGADAQGERLVRAGKRLATALEADWMAVFVETPPLLRLSDAERDRRIRVLRLAEALGAETVTLGGQSAAEEILDYARVRNVTRILVGQPNPRGIWGWWRPSTVRRLIGRAGDIDVLVVAGDDASLMRRNPVLARSRAILAGRELPRSERRGRRYGWALCVTALCTLAAHFMSPAFELSNLVMVYLLGATLAALAFGRGPAVLVSILNVLAFDFFFVPPQYTFAVADTQYLVTFAIMLVVALTMGTLTATVRQQARVAGYRQRRSAVLYAMSRELAATRGVEQLACSAVRHTAEVFEAQVSVLLPDGAGRIVRPRGAALPDSLRTADLGVAQWVYDHARPAGLGTDSLPGSEAIYLPLAGSSAPLGVLALLPANPRRVLLPEQRHLLDTFASQIALALERAQLADQAEHAAIETQTEQARNALLSGISHDLRTPLSVIAGAASHLAVAGGGLRPGEIAELARGIQEQASFMTELVSKVLDMTRIETGGLRLRSDWESLEEVIGAVLVRLESLLAGRALRVHLAPDLPLLRMDATLIEQVFGNLLENAAKYTPAGTPIDISAERENGQVSISVADRGPGLPPGREHELFDKFTRAAPEGSVAGVGLGLAICRAIVAAHGGRIDAEARAGGGALFRFTLP
ncbi:MAG: sensor histidine kinase KdpD, partial [Rhodocyclaceae bacterium]|nr:sensor histidine kinase KdpD [Rhodocyclaceae bacterium]